MEANLNVSDLPR